jgi:hypothetical protein
MKYETTSYAGTCPSCIPTAYNLHPDKTAMVGTWQWHPLFCLSYFKVLFSVLLSKYLRCIQRIWENNITTTTTT